LAPLEYDVKKIHHFLNPGKGDWDWSKYVKFCYPELNKGDSREKIRRFLIKFKKKNKKKIQNKMIIFKKRFEKISDKIVSKLMEILEIDTIKTKKITILISLCPINPYDLKKKNFSVYWNSPIKHMIATSEHEILHFIYYEKWKEIFPEATSKDFQPPSLHWHLSELIAPIVLNDKKIKAVFDYPHRGYEEHEKLKINGKGIFEILLEMYNKKRNFSSFIKDAYNFLLKHEKEIQEI